MTQRMLLPILIALGTGCAGGIVAVVMSGRKARLEARLQDIQGGATAARPAATPMRNIAAKALPKMGSHLMPTDEKERTRLQARLVQAGLYRRQAMVIFLGVKMLMMVGPAIIGLAVGLVGLAPTQTAAIYGACLGFFGMIGPSFWLDRKRASRQASLRRGLPDAFDVIVLCVEGGLSLVGALRRVTSELRGVYSDLAMELDIVQREIQLGQTSGEALRRFGERSDIEEIRNLAAVIIQSERFGAGLNKALRLQAETMRSKRQQRAEEMAQKAGTKILFPTLLFIFPTIFVVVLGPAMISISKNITGGP